jgi:Protein of unknown function (DUF2971)
MRLMKKATKPTKPDLLAMKLWAAWEERHLGGPAILYHYTAADGLLGMLQSHQIWTTNVRFMNDRSELDYGINLVCRVFEEDEFVGKLPPQDRSAFAKKKANIRLMLDDAEKNTTHFAISFCEKENLLSQWRGYGQSGSGFALGFQTDRLGEFVAEPRPGSNLRPEELVPVMLRRVIYEEHAQKDFVRSWIRAIVKSIQFDRSVNTPTQTEWPYTQLDMAVIRLLYECLVCFKHPGFYEEEEWRLIQQGRVGDQDVTKVDFRTKSGRIVSYTPLTFRSAGPRAGPLQGRDPNVLPIVAITYGPTLDPGGSERALRAFLASRGYHADRIVIRPSGIPFTTQ